MQDRIKELRKSLGLTQKDFGERLGVQANTITSYESGVRTPNNSMILAICREYGVSETWLRTGEGEMKQKLTRNQEIAEFMATVMRDPDDAPRKRFISIVSKLDIEEWQLLEAIAKNGPRTNNCPRSIFYSMRPVRAGSARPDRVVPSSQAAACGGCPAGKNFASFYPFPHSSTKRPFIFCSLFRLCFPFPWLTIFVG